MDDFVENSRASHRRHKQLDDMQIIGWSHINRDGATVTKLVFLHLPKGVLNSGELCVHINRKMCIRLAIL